MSTAELLSKREYKYGFVTDIESDMIPRGLTEDTIRLIVEKKNEPDWMLEFRRVRPLRCCYCHFLFFARRRMRAETKSLGWTQSLP